MASKTETVRQLAPHWVVMFGGMVGLLALAERVHPGIALWQSLLLVFVVAFGYPIVLRRLGVAPEVWQRP